MPNPEIDDELIIETYYRETIRLKIKNPVNLNIKTICDLLRMHIWENCIDKIGYKYLEQRSNEKRDY